MKNLFTLPDRVYDFFFTSDLSYRERQYAKAYMMALTSMPRQDPKHVSLMYLRRGGNSRLITDVKYYLMLNGYLTSDYQSATFKGTRIKSFYFNGKPKLLTAMFLKLITLGTFQFSYGESNSK